MLWRLSQGIQEVRPDLQGLIERVARECQKVDKDLRTTRLLFEARRHPVRGRFQGYCRGQHWSMYRGELRDHAHGWIQIVIGDDVRETDIVRVVAHELRHAAQFRRGQNILRAKRGSGHLNLDHMDANEIETDAYLFEYKMLDRLGIDYP